MSMWKAINLDKVSIIDNKIKRNKIIGRVEIMPDPIKRISQCIYRLLSWLTDNHPLIIPGTNMDFKTRHILGLTQREYYQSLNLKVGEKLILKRKYKNLYDDEYILEKAEEQ